MSRSAHPLAVADLSAFAKSLRSGLGALGHPPSHVEMLNLVCRSAGFRNYQAFRAHAAVRASAPPPEPRFDRAQVEKATRQFDDHGRLLQWPARAKQAELCLWVLWSRVPAAAVFTEREISRLLNQWHVFGDAALLRRALFDFGFVDRNRDGSEYRRIERKPPDELKPLLFVLRMRQDTAVA
jgi:hypothetical protein